MGVSNRPADARQQNLMASGRRRYRQEIKTLGTKELSTKYHISARDFLPNREAGPLHSRAILAAMKRSLIASRAAFRLFSIIGRSNTDPNERRKQPDFGNRIELRRRQ